MRALTVKEVLKQKKRTFAFKGKWKDAFGEPERTGVWFIWGNSGNGKSSFVMQLCKYLCEFDRVAYNSLEEGDSLTMQNTLKRYGMSEVNKSFYLLKIFKDLHSCTYVLFTAFQQHLNLYECLFLLCCSVFAVEHEPSSWIV